MCPNNRSGRDLSSRYASPLDTARTAFRLLTIGPAPISIDGQPFSGLPARRVPLDEVRDRLLARDCPQVVRDAVWTHLVLMARTKRGAWTVGCVGVALPALVRVAAKLSARFAADPADIHAEVLAGFLQAVATIDLRRPRIMLRLRWAAYRAGHAALTEALNAPTPCGDGFRSAEPPPPFGHPDLVLARAAADEVITAAEANLIGDTRLDKVPLRAYASDHQVSYEACKKARQRAERRLVAYLRGEASNPVKAAKDQSSPAATAATSTRRLHRVTPTPKPRPVGPRRRRSAKDPARLSPPRAQGGVQGCGTTPHTCSEERRCA